MKNLLDFILTHLVDYPEDIAIEETENEYGESVYEIKLNEADAPRIIGRSGSMIKAIRKLVQNAAFQEGQRIKINLEV